MINVQGGFMLISFYVYTWKENYRAPPAYHCFL